MSRMRLDEIYANLTWNLETGCYEWVRSTRSGYGSVRYGGKKRYVHVVVYETEVGPVPEGLELDHKCRNRKCANLLHLEPVDHQTNVLRGDGLAALNARKTHCPNGHPLTDSNLSRWALSRGRRSCRTCLNERAVLYQRNRRA